jgi:hypothetical protein
MSWAAQIEEIDASKSLGSRTSAGIRFFRSSAVWFRLGVEAVRSGSGSGSGDEDEWREGVVNLTPGLGYGRGRLCDTVLTTGDNFGNGGHSRIAIRIPNPHRQAPVFSDAVATKRKPSASNKL